MGIFQWLFGCQGKPRCFQRWADHDERIDSLERKLRSLDSEWEAFYDKTRHMMGRIVKRAAIIEASDTEAEGASEAPEAPEVSSDFLGLTPKQLDWQKRIAAERRSRGA